MELRPVDVVHNRFFLYYDKGKCTRQPVGINSMGKVPNTIATWLELPQPELYTGHSFRRTSATFLADGGGNESDLMRHGGWKSATVARSYVEKSLYNQKEINKKITNVINFKNTENQIPIESVDYLCAAHDKPSCSKQNALLKKKISSKAIDLEDELIKFQEEFEDPVNNPDYFTTSTQNATLGSTFKENKREIASDHVFTSSQNTTCESKCKKRKKSHQNENYDPMELLQKNKKIKFCFNNCNVTINVYNENKK